MSMLIDMWGLELPEKLDAAGARWPILTEWAEKVRRTSVFDPIAATIIADIRLCVEREVDPELIYREGDEVDLNLIAVVEVVDFLMAPVKAGGGR